MLNSISEIGWDCEKWEGKCYCIRAIPTNGFIDVNDNTTIQTFLQTKSSRIDIADGKSLTLTDTFEVPVDQTMEFYGDPEVELSILATT